jgi:fucose permease
LKIVRRNVDISIGGNNLLLTMWGPNAAAPLNIVHLGYGIGAVLVNLLVRPFLTKNVLEINIADNKSQNLTLSSVYASKVNKNLFLPYSITATLCVLIAAGHIFFYIRELKSQRVKLQVRQVRIIMIQ